MLEKLPSQRNQRKIFRLASISLDDEEEFKEFASQLQLDDQGIDELRVFLGRNAKNQNFEELLDAPFRTKRKYKEPTRFSDGTFPVFYSALDAVTAEAEMKYRLPKYISQSKNTRTVYYRQFSCIFDGGEMDLRSKISDWPDLMHDNDYTFCNQIGAEAKNLNLDGIVTVSVRRNKGANLPIFSRSAVRNPEPEVVLAMTYDPNNEEVTIQHIDG